MIRRPGVLIAIGLAVIQTLMLLPLFGEGEPAGADLSIHLGEISCFIRAMAARDPNVWCESGNLGYAGALVYQSLPQFVTALPVHFLGTDLLATFKLAVAIPLIALPLTTYRALVVAGNRSLDAACAATAVVCVFTPWPWCQWSIGFDSTFQPGLFTQAWATAFYPLALVYTNKHVAEGGHLGRAALYVFLTGACHPFLAISLVPAVAVTGLSRRIVPLAGVVLLLSAFLWLPIITTYDDFGSFPFRHPGEAGIPLSEFVRLFLRGDFLDHERMPVLEALLIVAIVLARKVRAIRIPLLQGGVLLALIVIGPLLDNVVDNLFSPIRFTPAMQFSLAGAAGLAAAHVGRQLSARSDTWRIATTTVGLALLIYIGQHTVDRAQSLVWMAGERMEYVRGELDEMIDALKELPHGRVLGRDEAGTGSHWWLYLPWVYASQPAVRAYGGAARQGSPAYAYLHQDLDVERQFRVYAIRYLLDRSILDDPANNAILVHRAAIEERELRRAARTATVSDGPFGYWRVLPNIERYVEIRQDLAAASTATAATWRSAAGLDVVVRRRTTSAVLSELPIQGFVEFAEDVTPLPVARSARRPLALAWLEHPPPPSNRGRVIAETWAPSRYTTTVEIGQDAPLWAVVAISHHRGWSATVDGIPAEIVRVLPATMAVRIPAGRHELRMTYARPLLFWWLVALAGLTAGAVLYYARSAARW